MTKPTALDRLFRTSLAYKTVFLDGNGNLTPAARLVIADLARYAAIDAPTVVSSTTQQTDIPATFQRIGRGDAVRRIYNRLKISPSAMLDNLEAIRDD